MPPKHMSLKDLQEHAAPDEGEHSDEGDDPQSFYAGGKHSRMMVEGGPKRRNDDRPNALARQILDLARQNAGQPEEAVGKEDKGKSVFRGSAATKQDSPKGGSNKKRRRIITFWQDGFTIELGEDEREEGVPLLRSYDDPASQRLLQAIKNGTAPLSELKARPGEPIDVQVVHQLAEPFKRAAQPSNEPVVFVGGARRLADEPSASTPQSLVPDDTLSALQFPFDSERPTVVHQVRMPDNRRLAVTFNVDTPLSAMHAFLAGLLGGKRARILVGHPPTEVSDGGNAGMTLGDAGLGKAAVLTLRFV